ncbi:MAG: S-methyl-5-thioribose-1-phosphate isomerase [Candidatus Riflebacteria bacterium]|nr:S-methyl-5-thioribose-1-phosphate isomerase [Candidatus Riflebacteria bacterium]
MIELIKYNEKLSVLSILEQASFPDTISYKDYRSIEAIAEGIRSFDISGAELLGSVAAYGMLMALYAHDSGDFPVENVMRKAAALMIASNPAAGSIYNSVNSMLNAAKESGAKTSEEAKAIVFEEAKRFHETEKQASVKIGENGSFILEDGQTWLVIGNSGSLSSVGSGSVSSIFKRAKSENKNITVYVCETRPSYSGSRLTAWELQEEGISAVLITEATAGMLMRAGKIDGVMTGVQLLSSKGFALNDTGTYMLAVLAKYNSVPFYLALPSSSIVMTLAYDDELTVPERNAKELVKFFCKQEKPGIVKVYNPAVDITPPELIDGIITEKGYIEPRYSETIPELVAI